MLIEYPTDIIEKKFSDVELVKRIRMRIEFGFLNIHLQAFVALKDFIFAN